MESSMNHDKEAIELLNKKYHLTLLYDFYGELLKENNRQIYEDYILNDLSLGEIASERGVSRQGVYDTIKRTVKKLEEYESKIHLIERYDSIHRKVTDIQDILSDINKTTQLDSSNKKKIDRIGKILEDISNET